MMHGIGGICFRILATVGTFILADHGEKPASGLSSPEIIEA